MARKVGWAILVLTLAGCSWDDTRRFFYDEGQQYACTQRNENRPDESMNDLKCMSPAEREGMSYEEYQKARMD